MEFGLSETTLSTVRAILAAHPKVESAIVYGSRAKGNYKPGSDIDLTLMGSVTSISTLWGPSRATSTNPTSPTRWTSPSSRTSRTPAWSSTSSAWARCSTSGGRWDERMERIRSWFDRLTTNGV
jgi:hypothetical protein